MCNEMESDVVNVVRPGSVRPVRPVDPGIGARPGPAFVKEPEGGIKNRSNQFRPGPRLILYTEPKPLLSGL